MKQLIKVLILFLFATMLNAQFHVDTLAKKPEISFPVAIAFPPDSSHRMFYTEKITGKVRIFQNDTLLPDAFVSLSVATAGEQGMLGITFDPEYPDSPYVYLFFTRSTDRANMVVKYIDSSNIGIAYDTLLVIPRIGGSVYHNGGNIHFGPDKKLYVTVGDNALIANGQDTNRTNPRAKINRINSDGSIPADNPIAGSKMYSFGHRNSFDFTFDSETGRMYASENGVACNDEINLVVPFGNFGWPVEGNCNYTGNTKYQKPLYHWPTNVPAVTGILVYRDTVFADLYGKLLVTSYNDGLIYMFGLNEPGDSLTTEPQEIFSYGSGLNDIEVGPNGYLYLTNGTYDSVFSIIRLSPSTEVPPAPMLVTPIDSLLQAPTNIALQWHPTIETGSYHLQLSLDSLFTTLIVDDSLLTDTLFVVDSLETFTTYYWRVRALNGIGYGEYSMTYRFTTILPPPLKPVLELPEDNSVTKDLFVTFRWACSPTSDEYELLIAADSQFSSVVIDSEAIVDTFAVFGPFQHDSLYYWKVRASNLGGDGEYSEWRSFRASDSLTFVYELPYKWNLISLARVPDDFSREALFPTAVSDAFSFSMKSGYVITDSLEPGYGYWLKFDSTDFIFVHGEPLHTDTIDVLEGWNLVGSLSDTMQVTTVQTIPDSILISQFYEFETGYSQADVLLPGKGYWVKSSTDGKLIFPAVLLKQRIQSALKQRSQ